MDFGKRAEREQRAQRTLRKDVPDLLRASLRAQTGVARSECIVNPSPVKETPSTALPRSDLIIRLQPTDALQAAQRGTSRSGGLRRVGGSRKGEDSASVAVHNMGSLTRPGGGFIVGANGQEEFLCTRTTLYASLWRNQPSYPLPEVGGIYSPDILVFRNTDGVELPRRHRFHVNVITAGVGKHPDPRRYDEAPVTCSCGVSYCDRDRDIMVRKMRAVMRMAQSKGNTHIIIGDWGCGPLRHPVKEVAKLWRKILARGTRQTRPNTEQWEGIKEIIFAIPNSERAREFRHVFEDVLSSDYPVDLDGASPEDETDEEIIRLMALAGSLELRIDTAQTSAGRVQLREELGRVMKLVSRRRAVLLARDDSSSDDEVEDDYVVGGYDGSDAEDNSFYRIETTTSDSDSDAPRSEVYEFRFGSKSSRDSQTTPEDDDDVFDFRRYQASPKMSPDGWFQGSIDELSAHLYGTGQIKETSISPTSPLMRCESHEKYEPDPMYHVFTQFG